jgi:type VI secretion system protein ImpK
MPLSDFFMPVIAYMLYFLKTVDRQQPSYDQVKADVSRLLAQAEEAVRKGLVSPEDFEAGRFAVCAWIDEAILNSNWPQKQQWQREQLQRLYYQTTEAGEEFFERLNALGLHQREVREVYYLCLALGFMGRFHQPGDEVLLEQLKNSNLKILTGSSLGLPTLERKQLFPEYYPTETIGSSAAPKKSSFPILTIVGILAPLVLFGALFFIYRFILRGVGENFISMGF